MVVGNIVIEGPSLKSTVDGEVGIGCGYVIDCNLHPVIFLLVPAFPWPFLGG